MAMTGSISNTLSLNLTLADSNYEAAEQFSVERKVYSKALRACAAEFSEAIKKVDCDTILRLERVAQEFDFRREKSPDSQLTRATSLTGLYDVQRAWEDGKDAEKVRQRFGEALEGVAIDFNNSRMKDVGVEAYVRTQCRRIGVFAGGTAVPAEKLYYNTRKDALQFFQKEHQRNIDKALGFERGKSRNLQR